MGIVVHHVSPIIMPQHNYSAGPPQCLCTYNPEPVSHIKPTPSIVIYVHRRPPFGQRLLIGGSSSTRLMIIILWQADHDPPAIRRSCVGGVCVGSPLRRWFWLG